MVFIDENRPKLQKTLFLSIEIARTLNEISNQAQIGFGQPQIGFSQAQIETQNPHKALFSSTEIAPTLKKQYFYRLKSSEPLRKFQKTLFSLVEKPRTRHTALSATSTA